MAQMIRKQIYIGRHQLVLLTRLAAARGISEAEVIRQAIEHAASDGLEQQAAPDAAALEDIIQFALRRGEAGVTGQPLRWDRAGAYSERLDRYGPNEQMVK